MVSSVSWRRMESELPQEQKKSALWKNKTGGRIASGIDVVHLSCRENPDTVINNYQYF